MAVQLASIFFTMILVDNYVLVKFLGICPFLGVSKKLDSAVGMSLAVTFVMVLATAATWPIQMFLLTPPGSEGTARDLGYLQTIVFILIIAILVQLLENILKKFIPTLYKSLGVYLPLITTNCTILGVTILNIDNGYNFMESIVCAAGAGIGTLVSRIAAAVIIMALLNHPDHVLRVEGLLRFEFRGAIVKRILFIGIPNGMENGMFQAGKLMVLNLITTFGTSAVAANAIANSVAGVINVPGMALGLAIITVIGQCMGAGETGQAVYYTKRLVGASYLCMLVMSAALFFSAGGLVTLFHLSPEACAMAAQVLRACAVGNVLFWPLAFTLPNSLRAAGDAIFTMAVSLGSMFVCRVVLSYVFACAWGLNLGLLGVWLAMIADWVVRAAFFLFRYWRGRWKRIRVI